MITLKEIYKFCLSRFLDIFIYIVGYSRVQSMQIFAPMSNSERPLLKIQCIQSAQKYEFRCYSDSTVLLHLREKNDTILSEATHFKIVLSPF